MLQKLTEINSIAIDELRSLSDLRGLEAWRLRGVASLSIDKRKVMGASANELRATLERQYSEKKDAIKERAFQDIEMAVKGKKDVSLPGRPIPLGRLHPTTQMVQQICDIFTSLGFQSVEGPEVEWDYYNFEALNIPPDHPAHDMFATFWIDTEPDQRPMLLRTHTSPMQIRVMEQMRPPVRVVVPGKVYRYEATDATHESMFYQIEGLAVDENITFSDLKGTLYEFAKRLFGEERRVRFRCDYFPFVEPGVEMSIDCMACGGSGCRLCSNTGWIEILGAGMVHPDVLRRVDYDPEVYTGFAFGLGLERIPMLRYGIDDIRLFYSNDLRFLSQF
jgi:phenylalanyl-tRNA synthetase alpha chain